MDPLHLNQCISTDDKTLTCPPKQDIKITPQMYEAFQTELIVAVLLAFCAKQACVKRLRQFVWFLHFHGAVLASRKNIEL